MSDQVGVVYVEVRPDARDWATKLREQIRNESVTIKADADTTEANAQLDEATRTRTVKIKTDVSQFSQAASGLDSFIGSLGLLPALAVAAGSALVPLGAALVGVTAALGAPLAIAGGGATLFALLGGAAVTQTQKQLKAIDTLQTKLGGLTKGTQAYRDTAKELKAQQAALTPAQTAFAASLDKVKGSFAGLLAGKNGQALLGPIAAALDLLAKVLPLLTPIISAVGGAFKTLLGELSKGAGSQGFADFIHQLATQVGPDIVAFAHIAGNGIKGITGFLMGLSGAFGGPHNGVLGGLEQLSGKFADLSQGAGHSKWLKDFVAYFHQVGPQVGDTLGAVAKAIGHIVAALAPLGPVVLKGIQLAADGLSNIPIPVLTALAGALGALVLVQKGGGFKALSLLGKGLSGGGILSGSVQKVFVVNMGAGLGGGIGAKALLLGLTAPELAAIGATIGIALATAVLQVKIVQWESTPGPVKAGGMTPLQWDVYNRTGTKVSPNKAVKLDLAPLNSMIGLPQIRSTGSAFDALKQHAQDATRQLDLIGPHIHKTMAGAEGDVHHFADALNSLKDKRLKVIADTASAIKTLERIQSLRIHDKFFTVTAQYLNNERAFGPYGGMQHHALGGYISGRGTGSSDSVPSWLSNGEFVMNASATKQNRALLESLNHGGTGRSGPLVHVDRMEVRDSNDILRQSQNRLRARAGGGVSLLGAGA